MPNGSQSDSERGDGLVERRRMVPEMDKDEVAPAGDGDRREGTVVRAQPGLVAEVAGRLELAVPVERPAVVPAHEVAGGPRARPDDHTGAMRTHVVEATKRPVTLDDDEHGTAGNLVGDVLPGTFE